MLGCMYSVFGRAGACGRTYAGVRGRGRGTSKREGARAGASEQASTRAGEHGRTCESNQTCWTSRGRGCGHACACMQACKRTSNVQGRCWSACGHRRARTDVRTGVWSSELAQACSRLSVWIVQLSTDPT
ncbi:hypothetical protein CRG98_003038 [Punica granatum]|uniref:Uncharacterized protein n=1 Tax=Punica granatum TaxID=22663 RepID=A0A2I0L798_PUNGR|nr:hypothetical protein CRG98_003038 [Punica granatum]